MAERKQRKSKGKREIVGEGERAAAAVREKERPAEREREIEREGERERERERERGDRCRLRRRWAPAVAWLVRRDRAEHAGGHSAERGRGKKKMKREKWVSGARGARLKKPFAIAIATAQGGC
ncbi:hypothetical protein AAC387_Pa12g1061 [Persea americana]